MLKSFSITLIALITAATLGFALWQYSPPPAEEIRQNAGAVPIDEAEEYEYLLKDYGGRLAVFKRGAASPDMIFDVYVKSLPDFDRNQLQTGVTAKNYSELVGLIEDYTS